MKRRASPRPSARHTQLLSTLLRAWQESVPSEEWRRLNHGALRADAAALIEFGSRRRPTQTLLHVSCAPANAAQTEKSPRLAPRSTTHPVLQITIEAAEAIKKAHFVKFDETVELVANLGVDPKQSDQMVRGTVVLPHGLGKSKRVLVIATGEKVREAQDAGADFVGGEDMVQKIQEGWTDFDAVIATPDMMRSAGRLGKVLGPRGMMPNPKTGTVTFEVAQAVKEIKAGKVEFRVDKQGIIHSPIGKISFDAGKLAENAHALITAIFKAKPAAAKGKFVKKVTLSSTMGPGVTIDEAEVESAVAA